MSIIDKFKDLLEAIKRKNADTTRYDLDEMYFKALLFKQLDLDCSEQLDLTLTR